MIAAFAARLHLPETHFAPLDQRAGADSGYGSLSILKPQPDLQIVKGSGWIDVPGPEKCLCDQHR